MLIFQAYQRKMAWIFFLVLPFLSLQAETLVVESFPVETHLDHSDIPDTTQIWCDLFRKAQKTIVLSQFYFSNAPKSDLNLVLDELVAAGRRGVAIRIIAGHKFRKIYPETLAYLEKQNGVMLRTLDIETLMGGGVMHAKYMIVDQKRVFIGSQNFDWRALTHIHELGLLIESTALAARLGSLFELDWLLAGGAALSSAVSTIQKQGEPAIDDPAFQLLASPPALTPDFIGSEEKALVQAIDQAKHLIQIQVYQYYPTDYRRKIYYPVLDNALRAAVLRGVRVELLVSDKNNKKPDIDFLKSLAMLPGVTVKMISIPPWSGGEVSFGRLDHCKYAIFDEHLGWLGTTNWSQDYFQQSRNVSVLIKDLKTVKTLSKVFTTTWKSPYSEPVNLSRSDAKKKKKK